MQFSFTLPKPLFHFLNKIPHKKTCNNLGSLRYLNSLGFVQQTHDDVTINNLWHHVHFFKVPLQTKNRAVTYIQVIPTRRHLCAIFFSSFFTFSRKIFATLLRMRAIYQLTWNKVAEPFPCSEKKNGQLMLHCFYFYQPKCKTIEQEIERNNYLYFSTWSLFFCLLEVGRMTWMYVTASSLSFLSLSYKIGAPPSPPLKRTRDLKVFRERR